MNRSFPFDDVEGLLSAEDREYLRDLAKSCADVPGVFVEVGSLKGLSALCINSGAPGKTLICYEWEPTHEEGFKANTSDISEIVFVLGDFRDTLPTLKENVAFAFVDHDHEFETTKRAYELIWPRLSNGGKIAFHDYEHEAYPGATLFLKSLANPIRSEFAPNVVVFQK